MTSSSSSAPPEHNPSSRNAPGPVESAVERAADALEIKPKFRGWLHAGAAPFALAAGIVLIVLAPTTGTRIASAVYAVTGVLLFGVSAVYHRGNWSPKVKKILKRLDHTNIMLVIAGSYTPLAWSLLAPEKAKVLLWFIWGGAVAGVLFRLLWLNAPRWLYTPVYIALGLAALVYIPDFFSINPTAAVLICVGGAFYIAGAVVYALKKPNPSLAWFGFHEIFHAFTLAGFACHYVAILMAVLSVGAS
ncbi:hemolysin III [Arthrobacter sp. UYP6]|uniref:PAQR family membrane homeostasis protein TrhA n=1 Tax=Arthrobacter sp. UYP6 TaxID=1756378 RepID=UPI003391A157